MSERSWKWFKHGIQWNVRCNGIAANGQTAKVSIVVYTENNDRKEAANLAVAELSKYGYVNLTVYKMVCCK